ncbi:MAG: class I SAM-dependent methyltransferase [Melioribacteraceae bacterium]|nr:class I SAM-dependent methyltransferase [Melioribacteraceae bacterium]MCF8355439.1 class I SAM-dependent methyltransferase [Melioribacteraceae bacterium]MCF8395374.1 class I SAM-dependent methyltransferase [Melioribacteraceae bacterium]MCF8420467.1 class I SAM-dependent methyltransferase [Melioribacteraceae bacterium]
MTDWFKDWFHSPYYKYVYSHRNDDDAQKLLQLILKEIKPKEGSLILDAACGMGRHSIKLANLGYRVFGFDLSMNFLKSAQRSKLSNVQVDFFCSDIRNVNLKVKFDLILNVFTSFGYFESDGENFAFLSKSKTLLKENGFFILDYFNEQFVRENIVPQSQKKINGLEIFEKRKIAGDYIVKEILISDAGKSESFFERVKLYSIDNLVGQVESFGYNVKKIFGDYEGNGFDIDKSPRLILMIQNE